MPLQPGSTLGRYEIRGSVGSGGMGEVYRAHDPRLDRDVAVKILSEAHGADPEQLRRFEQEARAVAALSHPNILAVYDVGSHEGAPYLVFELLEGKTLRERLSEGVPSPAEVLRLSLQISRAVAAAHAANIVHRDLKPDNVFLTRDGTLKILDFGLAKLSAADGGEFAEAQTVDITEPGRVFGTLGYMSPEQLRGEPVDPRSDIFAVGMIVHEMVTGSSPFRRDTAADTAAAILREDPPPLPEDDPHLPPGLGRVVRRCLEKAAANRFQSASDLAFALESMQTAPVSAAHAAATPAAAAGGTSIAVLPFADMSVARDQGYFCEGIAEELINVLSRIDGLRVAARSSSFQFQGAAADIHEVGQRLGVDTVLEGSVRKAGDRLRITVQLIDASDGYHRWSERFDRKLEDVFEIQDEIAECVATAMRGVLTEEERETIIECCPITEVETYEYFLRGRQLINDFRQSSLESAKEMFHRAIEIDPDYAPAWAGLADAHTWIYQWWGGTADDVEAADRASRRALELAPNLAEAHASRGWAVALDERYDEAMAEFEEAIRLNPNSFETYYYYARTCFAAGQIERSAELFQKAGDVRPEDYQSMILLSQSLTMLGRTDEAQEANLLAVERVERQLDLNPTESRALSLGAHAMFDAGMVERAMELTERAMEVHPDEQGTLINAACLCAKAGESDRALDLLEQAAERGWGRAEWIRHDPDYDSIRDHPRFKAILEKLE